MQDCDFTVHSVCVWKELPGKAVASCPWKYVDRGLIVSCESLLHVIMNGEGLGSVTFQVSGNRIL